ncbi:HIRAN domain-containing protein [Thiomicrospira sp. WB1]|uniref:HIRAN domain-containing protein n=1 Tax=Thiomicrospira sp. WB1 TaxID=1685380 RepID=UPI001365FDC7|nr:HIRAN domain-containing protein [Thiomicrospira sp. WB1]
MFPVRGTVFYQAQRAWEAGWLPPEVPLLLIREPTNAYDPHAVQVWLLRPRVLLGYVPRELAPVVGWQLRHHQIQTCQLDHTLGLTRPGLRCRLQTNDSWQTTWVRRFWSFYQAWSKWRHPIRCRDRQPH